MVSNAFFVQLLAELCQFGETLPLAALFKDAVKKGEFQDAEKLEDFLFSELQNAPLQDHSTVAYFLTLSRSGLNFHLYRKDYDRFHQLMELVSHRLNSVRSVPGATFSPLAWEQYLNLASASFLRAGRHSTIEAYERKISELDWSAFDKTFIAYVSTLIGYTYLQEDDQDQISKSQLWLQKAVNESRFEENFANHLLLFESHFQSPSTEGYTRAADIAQRLRSGSESLPNGTLRALAEQVAAIAEAALTTLADVQPEEAAIKTEKATFVSAELTSRIERLPAYGRAYLHLLAAGLQIRVFHLTEDTADQSLLQQRAIRHAEQALEAATSINDTWIAAHARLSKATYTVLGEQSLTEKEVKEVIQIFKKNQDHPSYMQANRTYTHLLVRNQSAAKIPDILQDILKQGSKKIEEGGFYLILETMRLAKDIFLAETEKPGVSWMVPLLDSFFEKIRKIIDTAEENLAHTGTSMNEKFRAEYLRFEPVSHFNIKVYFQYQLYGVKMLRHGSMVSGDDLGTRIADQLINRLEDKNNPLSFIKADWEEFRLVPNDVRNNTVNKCISITKGDLPAAADHLEFSYRNLRSYITFKEVNRLGFFLDEIKTSNRQLELGIRLMFFDLYKSGTIFEVVFDMPEFLVKYAKTGFFSQDLERDLNIKGTTAKKYLKIMIDIQMIRQDKTMGRKHYYRLIRENVMTRLGKESAVIKP
jgi:hypothetical protein